MSIYVQFPVGYVVQVEFVFKGVFKRLISQVSNPATIPSPHIVYVKLAGNKAGFGSQ